MKISFHESRSMSRNTPPAPPPACLNVPEGLILRLSPGCKEDRTFVREVYGYAAEESGWFRERDRLFVLGDALSDPEAREKLGGAAPVGVLEVPPPPRPDGPAARLFLAQEDGTEVIWIRHPEALPEPCRNHWRDHASLFEIRNRRLGFTAYTSIHSYAFLEGADGRFRMFGPGGIRWIDYPDPETAISDALDMSLAVAMKIQVVRTPSGGNKIAVIGDRRNLGPALAAIFACYERMGLIVTSADLGLSLADLEAHALPVAPTCLVPMGVYRHGVPSALVTADAAAAGLAAMAASLPGSPGLDGLTVSMQGLGEVGYRVAQHLLERGTRLVIAEIDPAVRAAIRDEHPAAFDSGRAVLLDDADAVYDAPADIFFPCALRDILTADRIARFRRAGVRIIGGPANNLFPDQTKGPWDYHRAGLPVVPYEGIGAGGVTGVAYSVMAGIYGACPFSLDEKIGLIADYVARVLSWSRRYALPPQVISDRILFRGIRRRRVLQQDQSDRLLEDIRRAMTGPDRERESALVNDLTKRGLFQGTGRHPGAG